MKPNKIEKVTKREILVRVDERLFRRNLDLARKASMTPSAYAGIMLEAAMLSVSDRQSNPDLSSTVSGTLLLHGVGFDVDSTARTLGVNEEVVSRIVNTWQSSHGSSSAICVEEADSTGRRR